MADYGTKLFSTKVLNFNGFQFEKRKNIWTL